MAKNPISSLKFSDLIRKIEKGEFSPVCFINGDEEYLKTEIVTTLRKHLFKSDPANANLERITASKNKAVDLINNALEFSLFSGGKLLIVNEAQRYSKEDRARLLEFFPSIPQGNYLVLFHNGKFDLRTKYFNYLTKKATWLSLQPLTQRSAGFWIKHRLQKYKLRIDLKAMDLFIEFAGFSYSSISEEIDKLSLNFEPGATITIDDIMKYSSRSAVFSIFELTDALGRQDTCKAIDRLERLLESGEPLARVLANVIRHFHKLVIISSFDKKVSDAIVSQGTGLHPFFVSKCRREQLVNFDEENLEIACNAIFEAEFQSRFERIPHNYILENLVNKITKLAE